MENLELINLIDNLLLINGGHNGDEADGDETDDDLIKVRERFLNYFFNRESLSTIPIILASSCFTCEVMILKYIPSKYKCKSNPCLLTNTH